MDARNERASALGVGAVYARVYPNPDGTLGESDRLHLALCYGREAEAGGGEGTLSPGHDYQHRRTAGHHISFA